MAILQQHAQDCIQIWEVAAEKQRHIDPEQSNAARLWHSRLGCMVHVHREHHLRPVGRGHLQKPDPPGFDKAADRRRRSGVEPVATAPDQYPVVGDEHRPEGDEAQGEARLSRAGVAQDQHGPAVSRHRTCVQGKVWRTGFERVPTHRRNFRNPAWGGRRISVPFLALRKQTNTDLNILQQSGGEKCRAGPGLTSSGGNEAGSRVLYEVIRCETAVAGWIGTGCGRRFGEANEAWDT